MEAALNGAGCASRLSPVPENRLLSGLIKVSGPDSWRELFGDASDGADKPG